MSDPKYAYDQKLFDAGYYGGGARGGFPVYSYTDPNQIEQLRFKWDNCLWGGEYNTILFVGCALGFEVKYFRERGKSAYGVDISKYAITHVEPEAKPYCHLYDGMHIQSDTNGVDVVAAFDVLTLVPDEMIGELTANMVRVARKKIVIRTITKNFRNQDKEWDGEDGVSFRYRTFNDWDRMFSVDDKFRFEEGKIHHQYEGVYVWRRV